MNVELEVPADNPPKSKIVDAALILALSYAVLYVYSWSYWVTYLGYFGISMQFYSAGADQMLASVWFVLPFIAFATITLVLIMRRISKSKSGLSPLASEPAFVAFTYLILLYLLLGASLTGYFQTLALIKGFPKIYADASQIPFGIIGVFLLIVYGRKLHDFGITILKSEYLKLISVIVLFFAFDIFYLLSGWSNAVRLAAGESSMTKIKIVTSNQVQPPNDTMLIAHMDGKYFICTQAPNSEKPVVYIIGDDKVESAVIK